MKIEIRKAGEKDAYDISKMVAYSWLDTYSGLIGRDYLENKITPERIEHSTNKNINLINKTNTYFVATVDDKVVGIVYYEKSSEEEYKDYGYLESIYLDKKYQGLGIGKLLFEKGVIGLKEMGYDKFYLHCVKGNNTLSFYEKYSGEIKKTIKYPLRGAEIDAEVVIFDDIDKVLSILRNELRIK